MIKKKNKFFTLIFSCLPGAGQMYMGFMKLGCSLLTLFCFILFLCSFLQIGPLSYILPIIWFYAFFDSINKMSLSDHDFYSLKDDYLFHLEQIADLNLSVKKNINLIAIALIVIGCTVLWNSFFNFLIYLLPGFLYNFVYNISYRIPQILFALFIIYIGIRMIKGKKQDIEKEEQKYLVDSFPNDSKEDSKSTTQD